MQQGEEQGRTYGQMMNFKGIKGILHGILGYIELMDGEQHRGLEGSNSQCLVLLWL